MSDSNINNNATAEVANINNEGSEETMNNDDANVNATAEVANTETKKSAEEVLMTMVLQLQKQIAELKVTNSAEPKNKRPGRVDPSTRYILLNGFSVLRNGKVPQQQLDLARIIGAKFNIGEVFTQAQLYQALNEGRSSHRSLYTSVQDVTYLFRYYFGLRDNGKQAGFVARNYMREAQEGEQSKVAGA